PPLPLDVDLIVPVDHDLGDRRVCEEILERTQAEGFVQHLLDDSPAYVASAYCAPLLLDEVEDLGLGPGPELLELGGTAEVGEVGLPEVDLLAEPPVDLELPLPDLVVGRLRGCRPTTPGQPLAHVPEALRRDRAPEAIDATRDRVPRHRQQEGGPPRHRRLYGLRVVRQLDGHRQAQETLDPLAGERAPL